MGSKNCPETPRQKMINVMYLVLTAMLALNVDKGVLDAFYTVDEGLSKTIANFEGKNESVYGDFDGAFEANRDKVGPYKDKSDSIRIEADKLFQYIEDLKTELIFKADGPEANPADIQKKDDTHVAALMMLTEKKGVALKAEIVKYRELLVKFAEGNESMVETLQAALDTSDPKPVEGKTPSWESDRFEGYPLIAVITLMTKMQSDVRNSEADMINYLYSQIDAASFKFNKLVPQVIPQSTYVLEGSSYNAEIFLAAVDTTKYPEVTVGSKRLKIDRATGKGQYSLTTSKAGTYKYSGIIEYEMPDGSTKPFPFDGQYEVAKPSLTISPTKMNVFYMGVPNPVSISVPGLTLSQIKPSITNGKLVKKGNGYIAYPKVAGKPSVISVSAMLDGKNKKIGSMDFRVKKVPDPIATIGNKNSGSISKSVLVAQQGILAEIPEFDFDLKFKVTSFVVSTTKGGFIVDKKSSSNRFTAEQMTLLKGLNSGGRVYFDNIMAKGEDGTNRKLASISFKIK